MFIASLLPRWRGAAPIQRAILAGDTETGISIMQMDAGLDTGPILQERVCHIEQTDTSQILQDRLATLGAQALTASLYSIQQGSCQPKAQTDQDSTYAKKINKAEAEIDWSQSAVVIDRIIRAFNPKPVAYTFLNGLLLRVWAAKVLDDTASGLPGSILHVGEDGIDIMTGKGVVRLLQLQLPGRCCLPVAEILRSKSHWFNLASFLGRTDD